MSTRLERTALPLGPAHRGSPRWREVAVATVVAAYLLHGPAAAATKKARSGRPERVVVVVGVPGLLAKREGPPIDPLLHFIQKASDAGRLPCSVIVKKSKVNTWTGQLKRIRLFKVPVLGPKGWLLDFNVPVHAHRIFQEIEQIQAEIGKPCNIFLVPHSVSAYTAHGGLRAAEDRSAREAFRNAALRVPELLPDPDQAIQDIVRGARLVKGGAEINRVQSITKMMDWFLGRGNEQRLKRNQKVWEGMIQARAKVGKTFKTYDLMPWRETMEEGQKKRTIYFVKQFIRDTGLELEDYTEAPWSKLPMCVFLGKYDRLAPVKSAKAAAEANHKPFHVLEGGHFLQDSIEPIGEEIVRFLGREIEALNDGPN